MLFGQAFRVVTRRKKWKRKDLSLVFDVYLYPPGFRMVTRTIMIMVTHDEAEDTLIDDLLASVGHLGRSIINLLLLLDIIYSVDTINESDAYAGQDSDWKWCRVL